MHEGLNDGILERFSKLVCENLIACPVLDSGSGLWEGLAPTTQVFPLT